MNEQVKMLDFCLHFTGEKPNEKNKACVEWRGDAALLELVHWSDMTAMLDTAIKKKKLQQFRKSKQTPPGVKGPVPPCPPCGGACEGNQKRRKKNKDGKCEADRIPTERTEPLTEHYHRERRRLKDKQELAPDLQHGTWFSTLQKSNFIHPVILIGGWEWV